MPRIGNVEVSDDIVSSLSRAENARAVAAAPRPGLGTIFGAAAENVVGQVRYGLPYQVAKLRGTATPEDEAYYQQGLAETATAASAAPAASLDDLTAGKVGFGRFIGENLAASLPSMAGAVVGGIGGALVGGPVGAAAGAVAGGIPIFSASNVARAVEESGELTEGAAFRAAAVAPLQSAADAAIARFLPGAGKVLGDIAATQSGGFLRRTATSMLEAAGTEAVTEASQQFAERYAAGIPVSDADAAGEYVNAAVTAFALGGVLGAGGGFRRTNAVAKPADMVEIPDIQPHVDGILNGSLRALPPPSPENRAPGAVGDISPPPAVGRDLDFVVDAQGNTAPAGGPTGFEGADLLEQARNQERIDALAGGRPSGPTDAELLARMQAALAQPELPAGLAATTPAAFDGTFTPPTTSTSIAALTGSQPAAPQLSEAPQFQRPFQDVDVADLNKARKAKNADPAIVTAIDAELEVRKQENPFNGVPMNQDIVKLRDVPLEDQVAGVRKLLEDGDSRTGTLKLAERLGIDLSAPETEVQAPAAAGTLEPAPLAPVTPEPAIASTPAPATTNPVTSSPRMTQAAADETFAARWDELKKAAGIQRVSATTSPLIADIASAPDMATAQAKVFQALASDALPEGRGSKVEVTQVEKIARTMGLITNDKAMDITPLGRQVFLSTPEGLQETVSAAAQQGYAGAQASIFDRGVRAQIAGETATPTFSNFNDMAAYQAGQVWAQDFVANAETRTAAQTEAIRSRQGARATGTIVTGEGSRREMTPAQIQQASVNRLIDAADLTTVSDSDVASLRRMARDGASPDEVGLALQKVQGGTSLFKDAPAQVVPDFAGERPTRGGQPRFVEMRSDPHSARTAGILDSKGAMRAETELAVQSYELRQRIETAKAAGKVTQARADKLHAMLDDGKVEQVDRASQAAKDLKPAPTAATKVDPSYERYDRGEIKYNDMTAAGKAHYQAIEAERNYQALLENEPNLTREEYAARRNGGMQMMRRFLNGDFSSAMQDRRQTDRTIQRNDPILEQELTGQTYMGALDHLIAEAPSVYHRELMRGVKGLAERLTKAGAKFDFKVVRPGDEVPASLLKDGVKAVAETSRNPATTTVYLKGAEMGFDGGMTYEVASHEMIHSVTQLAVDFYANRQVGANDKLGAAVKDLERLGAAVIKHFEARRNADQSRSPQEKHFLPPVLSELERQFHDQQTNATANIDEVLAWGLTNPDFQRYLSTIQYKPRQSVFGRLVELVRKLLQVGDKGIEVRHDSALAELLRVSEQIMDASQRDLSVMMARNRADGFATGMLSAALERGGARTVDAQNTVTQDLASRATEMVENLNLRDLGARARRTALGWLSHNQIDRQYGQSIPAVVEHSDAHRERVALRSRFEQMGEDAYQSFEQLEKASPKAAERVGQLMATTTEFNIDPDKTWEQHAWLADDPQVANLKRLHGEAVKLANDLKRGDGAGWKSFQNFRALNEAQNYARMAVGLHGLVATDPELSMGIENSWTNPADEFMRGENLSSAQQIRDHWSKALDAQVQAATAFVQEKKGGVAQASASEQTAMRQHLSPIEMQINAIHEAKVAMAKSPYFHLGRFGDNFGSAMIRKDADGNVDPAAQAKVAAALEQAGFGDAQISTDSTKPRFMLRFDTVDQAMRFRQVALALQKQGLLDADGEIKVGPRQQVNNFGTQEGLPAFVSAYIQNLEASPMFAADDGMSPSDRAALEKQKQDTIQLARDTWIEAQPDNSISKMLVKRNTIPGYNKDMIRNFAHRWRVGSINIANVASAPKFNKAFTNMKAQYNDALVANKRGADGELLPAGDPFTVQDVTAELKLRDAKNPVDETSDTFDKMRAYAHSYFLGFSPAYALINTTQLGVTALPELAKKHGYSPAFHAMRRASAQAFAIVKAAGVEARKLGAAHWADVAITESVLKTAGLNDKDRDFMRHMLATGTIDIGSMARSLGQVADNKGVGGKTDVYLKWSSALGLYTETFSRLVTALAARELHGGHGADAQAYAAKTVSESMFDYQNWNTARQLGKKGFLGPVTPLLTQFMSYQAQITEKLYSEALDAFAKARPGESAEAAKQRKTEARRFITGHLAAVTALAGSMGLPFVTVFAAVIERLVDAFDDDDEPFDATAAYRNFLGDMLGKDVGEVLARGAPRALGFDISSRTGEQNLLPFSEFLADRRSWKDAVANTAGRSLGAVPSMLQNVLEGGSAIASGDVVGGMKTMLPVAYKSPIEAYRMSEEGYIDTKGNKLPMSPTAASYVWQLLGFSPSAKAEYGEARGDQAARRGEVTRQANKLRQSIVRALRQGETEEARDLIGEAIQFDADNPAFAVIPSISSSLERQSKAAAQSRAFSVPTGVSMKDVAGQQMTGYANF